MYVKSLTAMAAVLLLTGCATQAWVKEGASQQNLATDSYECERDLRQSFYYGRGLIAWANMNAYERRCMVARGWHLEEQAGRRRSPSQEYIPATVRDQQSAQPGEVPIYREPTYRESFPPVQSSGTR